MDTLPFIDPLGIGHVFRKSVHGLFCLVDCHIGQCFSESQPALAPFLHAMKGGLDYKFEKFNLCLKILLTLKLTSKFNLECLSFSKTVLDRL